jgi:Zn-dependent protease
MKVRWRDRHVVIAGVGSLPPLRLHWSLPIALAVFGRLTVGGALGVFTVILVHELGHAALVRWRRLQAVSIDMHWMGGECRHRADWATELDKATIAWGGVVAQFILLVASFVFVRTYSPAAGFVGDLMFPLIVVNAGMILFNLLPVGGLDGTQAWPLLPLLARLARRRWLERRRDQLQWKIQQLDVEPNPDTEDDEPRILH